MLAQRCQAGIVEEEAAEYAADGESEQSAVRSSSDEAIDETEAHTSESRSGRSCEEIILRYETTQSRRKLNSERNETRHGQSYTDVKKHKEKKPSKKKIEKIPSFQKGR